MQNHITTLAGNLKDLFAEERDLENKLKDVQKSLLHVEGALIVLRQIEQLEKQQAEAAAKENAVVDVPLEPV